MQNKVLIGVEPQQPLYSYLDSPNLLSILFKLLGVINMQTLHLVNLKSLNLCVKHSDLGVSEMNLVIEVS